MRAELPKPGSAAAEAIGCICPRGQNCAGDGRVDADGCRWFTYDIDCRVHFPWEAARPRRPRERRAHV